MWVAAWAKEVAREKKRRERPAFISKYTEKCRLIDGELVPLSSYILWWFLIVICLKKSDLISCEYNSNVRRSIGCRSDTSLFSETFSGVVGRGSIVWSRVIRIIRGLIDDGLASCQRALLNSHAYLVSH